jgi:hypothetical protein
MSPIPAIKIRKNHNRRRGKSASWKCTNPLGFVFGTGNGSVFFSTGVEVDSEVMYVADTYNNQIRKLL